MAEGIVGQGWSFPPRIGPHGRVALTSERNELEEAIRIILGTAQGQRVMRPTFGCRLHELIFDPNDSQTAAQAQRYVEDALGMWEPRIRLLEVQALPHAAQEGCLLISIDYEVKANHDRRSLVFPYYLIPGE